MNFFYVFFISWLTFVFLSFAAHSTELDTEILGGSLTFHTVNYEHSADGFSNKINPEGTLIFNQLYGIRQVEDRKNVYTSYTLLAGRNSVARPIVGATLSKGLGWDMTRLGFLVGAYVQGTQEFRNRGLRPFGIDLGKGLNLVPLLGMEWTQDLTPGIFTNTMMSMGLINLSVGYRF